jgi:hypothetical protein
VYQEKPPQDQRAHQWPCHKKKRPQAKRGRIQNDASASFAPKLGIAEPKALNDLTVHDDIHVVDQVVANGLDPLELVSNGSRPRIIP